MKYLFFDTETTGLPRNYRTPITDFNNWPGVVQLAYFIYDEDGSELEACDLTIRPDGFTIPLDTSRVHGITMERALVEGRDIIDVLDYQHFLSTEVIAYWQNRHLQNKPGITFKQNEKGGFIYIGTDLTEPILNALLPIIQNKSGLKKINQLPKGVCQVIRSNITTKYRFIMNSNYETANIPEQFGGFDILSNEKKFGIWQLEGHGVCIFKQNK